MAKDKITEYDATAANNTVVGDVNLAENSCLPSDLNTAVREVMSHQKEAFGSGTPLLVDQTNNRVGIGLTAPEQLLHLRNASGNCVAVLGQFGTGTKATITAASNQVEIKADSGTNDFMTFKTGSSERVRIQSGGGISFNGDTAAANALSDYEEGSFDPKVFQGGSEVSDAAYNSGFTGGQYTKIGRMCFITLSIRLTSKGTVTASNTFQIGNLPFVPIANIRARTAVSLFDHVGAGIDTSGNTNGTLMGLLTSSGTVSFRVSDVSGTVGEIIQFADIGNSLYLQLAFFFETS